MGVGDALDDRQAVAGAVVVPGVAELEDRLALAWRDASPVVREVEPALGEGADLDLDGVAAVVDRVGDQVRE